MPTWIKDLYVFVLKRGTPVQDIAIFPNGDETFALEFGDSFTDPMRDKRFIHVQDFINDAKVDKGNLHSSIEE